MEIFLVHEDIDIIKVAGDIVLLLSENEAFTQITNREGGERLIRGLLVSLKDPDEEIIMNACAILENLTQDALIHRFFSKMDENNEYDIENLLNKIFKVNE